MRVIRVGMDTGHLRHDEWPTISKVLCNIDSTYASGHFGKWGMDASPEILGFDQSDGATRNVDGGFVNNKTQWETTLKEDPKRFSM